MKIIISLLIKMSILLVTAWSFDSNGQGLRNFITPTVALPNPDIRVSCPIDSGCPIRGVKYQRLLPTSFRMRYSLSSESTYGKPHTLTESVPVSDLSEVFGLREFEELNPQLDWRGEGDFAYKLYSLDSQVSDIKIEIANLKARIEENARSLQNMESTFEELAALVGAQNNISSLLYEKIPNIRCDLSHLLVTRETNLQALLVIKREQLALLTDPTGRLALEIEISLLEELSVFPNIENMTVGEIRNQLNDDLMGNPDRSHIHHLLQELLQLGLNCDDSSRNSNQYFIIVDNFFNHLDRLSMGLRFYLSELRSRYRVQMRNFEKVNAKYEELNSEGKLLAVSIQDFLNASSSFCHCVL